jgi:hypothetical protein
MSRQQMMHAAVLHGLGQAPSYEPFPAPAAGTMPPWRPT